MFEIKITRKMNKGERRFLERKFGAKVDSALFQTGIALKDLALELVPRDTEYLAETARVTTIRRLFNPYLFGEVVVGFGGKDFPARKEWSVKEQRIVTRKPSEYAVYVHEWTVDQGGPVHVPGQAKFLEQPCRTKTRELSMVFRLAVGTGIA